MQYILKQIRSDNALPIIIFLNTADEIVIGKQTVASIANYHRVSRRHAVFRHISDAWYIRAFDANDTYVNFVKIGKRFRKLNIGDIIGLGAPFLDQTNGFVCVLTIQHKAKQEVMGPNNEAADFSLNTPAEGNIMNYENFLINMHVKQELVEDFNEETSRSPLTLSSNLNNISSDATQVDEKNCLSKNTRVTGVFKNKSSSCSEENMHQNTEENKSKIVSTNHVTAVSHDGIGKSSSFTGKSNTYSLVDAKPQHPFSLHNVSPSNNGKCKSDMACKYQTEVSRHEECKLCVKTSKASDSHTNSAKDCHDKNDIQVNNKEKFSNNSHSNVGSVFVKENTTPNLVSPYTQISENLLHNETSVLLTADVNIVSETSGDGVDKHDQISNRKLFKDSSIQLKRCSVVLKRCDIDANAHNSKNKKQNAEKNRILNYKSSESDEINKEYSFNRTTINCKLMEKDIRLKLKKNRILSSESSESDTDSEIKTTKRKIRISILDSSESDKDIEKRDKFNRKTISSNKIQTNLNKQAPVAAHLSLDSSKDNILIKNQDFSDSFSSHESPICKLSRPVDKQTENCNISTEPNHDNDSSASSSSEVIIYPSSHVLQMIKKIRKDNAENKLSQIRDMNCKRLKEIARDCSGEIGITKQINCVKGIINSRRRKLHGTRYLEENQLQESSLVRTKQNAAISRHRFAPTNCANEIKNRVTLRSKNTEHRNGSIPRKTANIMVGSSIKRYNFKIPKYKKNRTCKNEPEIVQLQGSYAKPSTLKPSELNKSNNSFCRKRHLKNISLAGNNVSFSQDDLNKRTVSYESKHSMSNLEFDKSKRINNRNKSITRILTQKEIFTRKNFKKYESNNNARQIATKTSDNHLPSDFEIKKSKFEINASVKEYSSKNNNKLAFENHTHKSNVKASNNPSSLAKQCEIRSQMCPPLTSAIKNKAGLPNKNFGTVFQNKYMNNQIINQSDCSDPVYSM